MIQKREDINDDLKEDSSNKGIDIAGVRRTIQLSQDLSLNKKRIDEN